VPPAPPGPRRIVRWGIGDAIWAFVVGLLVSVVAAAFVVDASRPVQLIVLIAAQDLTIIAWVAFVARRKGVGSLRADFGFTLRPAQGSWAATIPWFLAGIGIQLVSLLPIGLLNEIYGQTVKQDVVNSADKAHGWQVPLIILAVVVLAPVTEELLFRGVLLRSLLRRTTPERAVVVSAVAFGLVHVVGDPSVGSLIALPAIILLGVVSGWAAVKTGNLSRSMCLHIGFNVLSAVVLFSR
jgi:hypothetical protein